MIAVSLLIWDEAPDWRLIRTDRNVPVALPDYQPEASSGPDFSFNPCEEGGIVDGPMSIQEQTVAFANMPAMLVTGGHTPCATPSPLNAIIQKRYGRTHTSEALTLMILCVALAIQWLLVGGLPLTNPNHWRAEPGALITVLTLPMLGIAFITNKYNLPPLALYLTLILWANWFVLLIRNLCRSGWRLVNLWRARQAT